MLVGVKFWWEILPIAIKYRNVSDIIIFRRHILYQLENFSIVSFFFFETSFANLDFTLTYDEELFTSEKTLFISCLDNRDGHLLFEKFDNELIIRASRERRTTLCRRFVFSFFAEFVTSTENFWNSSMIELEKTLSFIFLKVSTSDHCFTALWNAWMMSIDLLLLPRVNQKLWKISRQLKFFHKLEFVRKSSFLTKHDS